MCLTAYIEESRQRDYFEFHILNSTVARSPSIRLLHIQSAPRIPPKKNDLFTTKTNWLQILDVLQFKKTISVNQRPKNVEKCRLQLEKH